MKSLLQAVRAHPLWSTVSTLGAGLFLIAVFAFVAPVRIQVTVSGDQQAAAAPMAEIPTATPAPPPPTVTPEPDPTLPPPPVPPTETAPPLVPPTETAPPADDTPEPEDDPDPTRTPVPPTATVPPPPPPTVTPVVAPPDVQIVKTSTLQVAKRGDEFEYVIVGRNAGGSVANDVVITDSMPAPMEILGITSSKGDYEVRGQSITVYPRTLAPGEEVRIVIRVRVRADAPAGIVRNLALIFTSTPGDPPPNRTDTPVEIVVPPAPTSPPITIQQVPPRMPGTADPAEDLALLLQYLPLFALALVLALAGGAAHFGAFRSRFVRVQIGYAGSRQSAAQAAAPAVATAASFTVREVEIATDPDALYARWRAGESVMDISASLAAEHPAVSKTQIAVVVQQLITDRQKA